jgi:hypothetical protein
MYSLCFSAALFVFATHMTLFVMFPDLIFAKVHVPVNHPVDFPSRRHSEILRKLEIQGYNIKEVISSDEATDKLSELHAGLRFPGDRPTLKINFDYPAPLDQKCHLERFLYREKLTKFYLFDPLVANTINIVYTDVGEVSTMAISFSVLPTIANTSYGGSGLTRSYVVSDLRRASELANIICRDFVLRADRDDM